MEEYNLTRKKGRLSLQSKKRFARTSAKLASQIQKLAISKNYQGDKIQPKIKINYVK